MQLQHLHPKFDNLQKKHGSARLDSIYGAGCIKNPDVCFIFMNPTGKNIASNKEWKGLKAPWLGTKNTWSLFRKIGIISKSTADKIASMKSGDWDYDFSNLVYQEFSENKIFVTNLGKCTQDDASHLHDNVFKEYLGLLEQEIAEINPKRIICFGNQVSSIFLDQPIKVSETRKTCVLKNINGKDYCVYPVYYPVGQGMRNMPLAIEDIKFAIKF